MENINALLKNLNKPYLEDMKNDKNINFDVIRNKPRIEIPAAFAISLLKEGKKEEAKKLLDLILEKQKELGYWLEYSYEKEEEGVGHYGAVPTCFCIFALLEGYKHLKQEKYLYSAIRACDYLYSKEKSGYFYKALQNKSDVINTNLLCALALMDTVEAMSEKSRRTNSYKGAAVRAIRRSLYSQKCNGALPYISYGIGVPFLYHSMSLSLLTDLSHYFKDSLLSYSIKKGIKYLNKITNKDGSIKWNKECTKDKTGSSWVYAWNYNLFDSLEMESEKKKAMDNLERLFGKKYLKEGDFGSEEDLFYTAWCVLAVNLSKRSNLRSGGLQRFYFGRLKRIVPLISLITRILERKIFSYGLDKGPVEYW